MHFVQSSRTYAILTYGPLMIIKNHPKFLVLNQMEESIGIERFRLGVKHVYLYLTRVHVILVFFYECCHKWMF